MHSLVAEAASLVAPAAIGAAADAAIAVDAVVTAAVAVSVHSCEKSHHPLRAVARHRLS